MTNISHIQRRPNPNAVKTNFGWVDKNTGELLVSVPGGFKDENEAIMDRPNIRGPVALLQEVPFQPANGIGIEDESPEPVVLDNIGTFIQPSSPQVYELDLALASEKDVINKAGPINLSGVNVGEKVTIDNDKFRGEVLEDGLYIKLSSRSLENVYGKYQLVVTVGESTTINVNLNVHSRDGEISEEVEEMATDF